MPAPGDDRPINPATAVRFPVTSGCGGLKINPATGLSTDYLNHFTEAVMLLELAGGMPECLRDLDAWQPKTYAEHFANSGFSNRDAIFAAYQVAHPPARAALDRTAGLLNALVVRDRELVRGHVGTPEIEAVARRSATRLRVLIARAAAVINGTPVDFMDRDGPQAAIDAMFRR
jgi:hypothetical protein